MIENNKYRKAYTIVNNNGVYKLVKILNEYTSESEANEDLLKLLTDEAKENDILKEYTNKKIF